MPKCLFDTIPVFLTGLIFDIFQTKKFSANTVLVFGSLLVGKSSYNLNRTVFSHFSFPLNKIIFVLSLSFISLLE